MIRSIYTLILFAISAGMVHGVYAQTPTPHPDALTQGMYQFEDLSAPDISLTGTGWTICQGYGGGSFRPEGFCNSNVGQTLTFFVENIDYIQLQTFLRPHPSSIEFQLCIESVCNTYRNSSSGDTYGTWSWYVGGNAEIVLTTAATVDRLFLDWMTLHSLPIDLSSISGTGGGGGEPSATATPNPYYFYGSVSGTSGDVETRFDMIVTAGDVAISSALVFLFFSLFTFYFIVVLVRRDG